MCLYEGTYHKQCEHYTFQVNSLCGQMVNHLYHINDAAERGLYPLPSIADPECLPRVICLGFTGEGGPVLAIHKPLWDHTNVLSWRFQDGICTLCEEDICEEWAKFVDFL
jgi:hypothetical protein